MSGLFSGLLRARRALALRAHVVIQQARYISGRQPKDNIGPAESMFVLTVLTVAVLGPSGWILAHLDYYKTRDDKHATKT